MRDRMKRAFDQVRASDALKRSTQASLARRLRGRQRTARALRLGTAVCALALCAGIPWLCMTPKPDPTLSAVSAQGAPMGELRAVPTLAPTAAPTIEPTAIPTLAPTAAPTIEPTAIPTPEPTAAPTLEPTATPTTGADEPCENADALKHGKNHHGYGKGPHK